MKEDRALLAGAQKLFGIAIALFEAVCLVASGLISENVHLGYTKALLVVFQVIKDNIKDKFYISRFFNNLFAYLSLQLGALLSCY